MSNIHLQEMIDDPAVPLDVRMDLFEALDHSNHVWGIYTRFVNSFDRWVTQHGLDQRPQPLRLLEMGSGGGHLVRKLAEWSKKRGIALEFDLLDMDPEVLSWAQQRLAKDGISVTTHVAGNAHLAQFADGQFDIIYCMHVLHHIPPESLESAIHDAVRVAAGGVFIFDFDRRFLDIPIMRIGGKVKQIDQRVIDDGVISLLRVHPYEKVMAACAKVTDNNWAVKYNRLPLYPYAAIELARKKSA